jgi:hypothetical protein
MPQDVYKTPRPMAFRISISHRLYFGLYSRIARQLAMDPSYVNMVAHGKRRSPKVEAAINEELARIQRVMNKK